MADADDEATPRPDRPGEGGCAGWRAGYAVADITPGLAGPRIHLAGYGVRRAGAVRDPLEVQAVALEHGDTGLVVVALDSLGLPHQDARAIAGSATAGTDGPQAVVVCCTHTHAAPDLIGLWGPGPGVSGIDPSYRGQVIAAAAQTAVRAWNRRRPAALRSAAVAVEGVAHNARDPEILDPLLTSLCWRDADDIPVVRVLHFACHPEALGGGDTRISADLAGAARRATAALHGSPCVWWPGALGGMVTPLRRPEESGEDTLVRLGLRLAAAAADAIRHERPATGGLRLARAAVSLPLANPALQTAAAAGILGRHPEPTDAGPGITSSAGLLQTGPYLWNLAPGEVLPGLARRWAAWLGAESGMEPRLLGLCDDELGYILGAADFTPGRYEESMSLGPETAPRLEAAYEALLRDWRPSPP